MKVSPPVLMVPWKLMNESTPLQMMVPLGEMPR